MKKLFVLFLCLFVGNSFASGIASNSASAPCTNNTLETYSGNSNLSADWQPNTINLTWYNEQEKLTVQQSAQSCVYDGTLTIPSTPPTRTGYTFAGWKVRIPGTYTELEYIESTGTQWIDTGVYQNTSLNSIETYAGIAYSQLPTKRELTGFDGSSSNYWGVYPMGNNVVVFEMGEKGRYAISTNTKYDIYVKQTLGLIPLKIYLNNTLVDQINTGASFNNSELKIFTIRAADFAMTNARMYYYRMLFDGEEVFNGIPAKRNSDNVVGLYDIVTQTFFTNAGTGAFIAGPVVQ